MIVCQYKSYFFLLGCDCGGKGSTRVVKGIDKPTDEADQLPTQDMGSDHDDYDSDDYHMETESDYEDATEEEPDDYTGETTETETETDEDDSNVDNRLDVD